MARNWLIKIKCRLEVYHMFRTEWELYKQKYPHAYMDNFLEDMIRAWRIYKNKIPKVA